MGFFRAFLINTYPILTFRVSFAPAVSTRDNSDDEKSIGNHENSNITIGMDHLFFLFFSEKKFAKLPRAKIFITSYIDT